MRISPAFALLMASSFALGADVATTSRYIITFADPPLLEQHPYALSERTKSADTKRALLESVALAKQNSILRGAAKIILQKSQVSASMQTVWTTNAVALDLTPEQAEQFRTIAGVAAVEINGEQQLHTDVGPGFVGATTLWNAGTRGEGVVVGVIDSGVTAGHPAFADIASDGYDHNNPRTVRFGLCNRTAAARCNDKLIGIYDYTTEGTRDGGDLDGHGTHVASTAVGNPFSGSVGSIGNQVPLQLSGVAPRANLISYKACRQNGSNPPTCPNDATLQAIEQAARDQVTVVNYSIGGEASDPFTALNAGSNPMRAMFNARAAGVAFSVSAGNTGPRSGSVQSPANAPWVLGVANSSNDRRFVNKLANVSGSPPPPQSIFEGASITSALPDAPIVLGATFGNAGCGTGEDTNPPYTGASNPFPPGTFNGQIVVCLRGQQARLAKGANVKLSGAGGMILVNTAVEGESIVNDEHVLPAVHLGERDGNRLIAWLRSAANARGGIAGTTSEKRAEFGDLLNSSSSRGPINGGYLKPDVAAPGTGIFAANTGTGVAVLSGTSMAAPHVTGSIALLKALHPNWRVEQLESAIRTSALSGVVRAAGASVPASATMTGHGRLDASAATLSLFHFPLSNDAIRAAQSTQSEINLPSMVSEQCFERCSFRRTLAANAELIQATEFSVSVVDAPAELVSNLNISSFTLAPGGTASISAEFVVTHPNLLGRTIDAKLQISGGGQRIKLPIALTVTAGDIPTQIDLTSSGERGLFTIAVNNLVSLKRPVAQMSEMQKLLTIPVSLAPDATVSDPYDDGEGTNLQTLSDVAVGSTVYAEISSSVNVDLFVGRDIDNNGRGSASEVICVQNANAASERCIINAEQAGTYWILAQNASSSASIVNVSFAKINGVGTSITTLPGVVSSRGSANLQLALEMGGSFAGERLIGALQWRGADDSAQIMARSVVLVQRIPGANNDAVVLHPGRAVSIGAGVGESAKRRIAFDVPANTSSFRVTGVLGGTLELQLFAAPSNEFTMTQAPTSSPLISASYTGSATLELNNPAPGRYYLVLSNPQAATTAASARLTLTLNAGQSPPLSPELYYNPSRSGHGLVATEARGDGQFIWYTYDQANQPTWYWFFPNRYFANNPGSVTGDLLRYTWDGRAASRGLPAGTATITRTGTNELHFAYTVLGQSGSEKMVLLGASSCANGPALANTDYTGAWYMPSLSGWGASIFSSPSVEFVPFFVYDQQGQPRWLLGSDERPNALFGAAANIRPLQQLQGFCPTCEYREPTRVNVGSYQFVLDAAPRAPFELSGRINLSATFAAPLVGSFIQTGEFALLTAKRACQ